MPNESDIAQDTSNHVSRITHDHDRAGTRNGVPDPLPRQGRDDPNRHRTFLSALEHLAEEHLNFYRIHLLFFTIVPLAFAGVFYAVSREDNPVSFIDSLFLCVSAITVAGLYPIMLSNISVGQQVILLILTAMGGVVSILVPRIHINGSWI
jgi:Trk-type K+ transport system membrane component